MYHTIFYQTVFAQADNERTMKPFFIEIPNFLGLGRQFGRINFGATGVFSANLSAPIYVLWVPCPYFSLINQYFYKETPKPFYPNPKYLFGIGPVWIEAAKIYRFIHRASVVH